MAKGVDSTTACQEWISSASELQAQIHAWNGNTVATDFYRSYAQSTEYRSRTSMSNETAKVLSDYILEEHAAVGEVGIGSLSRMDDAIGHDDFSAALSKASAALQRAQESSRNDVHVSDTYTWHPIERNKKLIESVKSRCNDGHAYVSKQLDLMVDDRVKDRVIKPWMGTEGSCRAISFAR